MEKEDVGGGFPIKARARQKFRRSIAVRMGNETELSKVTTVV